MKSVKRHIKRHAGLYATFALAAVAAWVIFEGIFLGRVRAFGIGSDYITPEQDPIQFYAIVVAAFGLFFWIGVGIFRLDREIKRKYR